jgi:hypothetical protein
MNFADGKKKNNYYVQESVGIAASFFVGSTSSRFGFFNPYPSPMNFLTKTTT